MAAIHTFKPATDIEGAEVFARSLGIGEVRYANGLFSPRLLRVANEVNKTLDRLADRKIGLPGAIEIEVDQAVLASLGIDERVPAAFLDDATPRIIINPWARYWDDLETEANYQHSQRWWSTAVEDHALVHEIGHANHFANAPDQYRKLANSGDVDTDVITPMAAQVSTYAVRGPREFVAEVFVGLVEGRVYSADVMRLYDSLGGVRP